MQSTTVERAPEPDTPSSPPETGESARIRTGENHPVRVNVHRSLEPVEDQWRALETVQSCPIHQTYDWCQAWVEATGAAVAILDIQIGSETVLLLPLEIVNSGGIRVACYISSPFCNINNGIFSKNGRTALTEAATSGALADMLRSKAGIGVDCIVLDKVPLAWRGIPHPLAALPHYPSQNAAFQITLDPSFDTVLSRTNAKRKRKKYRSSTKRLDAIGGWEHVVATTQAEASELIETFFRQKGARLRASGLPDVFEPEPIRNFHRALARRIPDAGHTHQLQMHAIRLQGEHDGTLCAIAGLSRKGDHFACQFASFDDTHCPDTSPGELLFHLMIEQSCKDGAAIFDLGVGDQRYKRSWCDVETQHYEIVLPLTMRGRVYARTHHAIVAAKYFIKHNQRLYRIASRIRALGVRKAPARN